MIESSAPGKLILFGEHVSRYGKPALVFAVDKRIHVYLEPNEDKTDRTIILDAPDLGIANEKYPSSKLDYVSVSIRKFFEKTGKEGGFKIRTKSDMPEGLGTSAATVVATLGALDAYFGTKLSKKQIYYLAFEVIFQIQGFGSGQDVATATYGGLIRFEKGKEPVQISTDYLPLVIGNTGKKVKSKPIVEAVQAREKRHQKIFDRNIESIGEIALEAQKAIARKDYASLGELMDINHGLLYSAGVSSEVLERLIWVAKDAGALGAKLSGAGIGDNMLALAPLGKEKDIAKAMEKAGAKVINAKIDPKGLVVSKK